MVTTDWVSFCTSWEYLFVLYFAQKESESEKKPLSLEEYNIVVFSVLTLQNLAQQFFLSERV